ncbi:hypothetical protein JOC86_002548 [Bacillus pakistanensis]|uniref:Uncharacterized protein n=1 Tax=Rossellomorea pakistanensis TaxID=992288 RepID=A0ABS2NDR9_9BACI|nr:hypothetical protein [Bacillus pakistanensis]MBM7586006.1 hypothetical protein [Bacillus pakistanensis]
MFNFVKKMAYHFSWSETSFQFFKTMMIRQTRISTIAGISVEVELVDYEMQSETQSRMIERFKSKGLDIKEWIPSGY